MWPPPLVNYVRGFDILTRKGKLVKTIAEGKEAAAGQLPPGLPAAPAAAEGAWDFTPEAFVFHPSKGEENPLEELRAAFSEFSPSMSVEELRTVLERRAPLLLARIASQDSGGESSGSVAAAIALNFRGDEMLCHCLQGASLASKVLRSPLRLALKDTAAHPVLRGAS